MLLDDTACYVIESGRPDLRGQVGMRMEYGYRLRDGGVVSVVLQEQQQIN